MKRSTKKVIFISAMLLTVVSLFATVGRHHHGFYQYENHCGHERTKHTCKNMHQQDAIKRDEAEQAK